MKDKALQGHVIHTSDVSDLEMCQFKCYLASSCISLNLGPIRANKKRSCELCDAHGDGNKHSDALTFREGYLHQGTNVNTYTDVVVILLFLCEGGRSFFPCNFPFLYFRMYVRMRGATWIPHARLDLLKGDTAVFVLRASRENGVTFVCIIVIFFSTLIAVLSREFLGASSSGANFVSWDRIIYRFD